MIDSRGNPGLYIHLPFCSSICPYCDFYVLTGDAGRRRRFVDRLRREVDLCHPEPWPDFVDPCPQLAFDTLYFGGGTPSLHRSDELQTIRSTLQEKFPLVDDPWIGLEANPEDITPQNLAGWRELGVSFLSLGAQSFRDENLQFLGRVHRSRECRDRVALARQDHPGTLSLDLIYGLPGQTVDEWRTDLETAVELEPDHLSCYQLTIEAGTPFGFRQQRGQLSGLPVEGQADLFFFTHRFLAERGFSAYEVSNFAASTAHHSRHNSKYWSHTPYLGLGPSAHSFASGRRWWNSRKIKSYEERLEAGRRPIEESEILTASQLRLEHLMLGLRTPTGVDFDRFPDDSGDHLWQRNRLIIEDLVATGKVSIVDRHLTPTLSGLAIAEAIACRFDVLES